MRTNVTSAVKTKQESLAFKHKHFSINRQGCISANLSVSWNATCFPQLLFIIFYGSYWCSPGFSNAETTSINSVCEPDAVWMKPHSSKSPLRQHKTTWQLVLQRNCAGHFSDMAFEGISSWLSLVKMLFFQLSYQCGRWPSERHGGRWGGGLSE